MAEPSIQPGAPINPDPLGRSVDRVIAIIRDLLPPDKAYLADELGKSLGDMFAELINRASSQSASVSVATHTEFERKLAQTNRRIDRKRTKAASLEVVVEDLRDRVATLERHVGGRNGDT